MKPHYICVDRDTPGPDGEKFDMVQVGLDVVVGDAVMDLIESGIDEDAHFWGQSWRELDADELEFAINDSSTVLKLVEYVRPLLLDQLREVVADLRAEKARHPGVG